MTAILGADGRRQAFDGLLTLVVPARTAHWFGNADAEVAHARVEVRPALRMEELFEATEAIGRAGRLPGALLPRLTDLALLVLEFHQEVAPPNVPALLIRLVLLPLAWLARRRANPN